MTDVSPPSAPLRLGVSACIVGERVRWDGGHRHAPDVIAACGSRVAWVSVCPEMEIGLGTPREPIRLEGDRDDPRLVAPASRRDHTARMRAWSRARLDELERLDLHGFVLQSGSPSCGLRDVPVHAGPDGPPGAVGRGLFAAALAARFPGLPLEQEDRLRDPGARERFLAAAERYRRRTSRRGAFP